MTIPEPDEPDDENLEVSAERVHEISWEMDKMLVEHKSTCMEVVMSLAYLYRKAEKTAERTFANDGFDPMKGRRYIATEFARYVESARKHFD